jgi:hypothetical protein
MPFAHCIGFRWQRRWATLTDARAVIEGFLRRIGLGFGPYYNGYYPYNDYYYDDGGCYIVRRHVHTRYGWRVRPVCG